MYHDYEIFVFHMEHGRLPTLFFVKDGKLRYRMEGALSADQLEEIIDFVLFDGPPPSFAKPPQSPSE